MTGRIRQLDLDIPPTAWYNSREQVPRTNITSHLAVYRNRHPYDSMGVRACQRHANSKVDKPRKDMDFLVLDRTRNAHASHRSTTLDLVPQCHGARPKHH